MNSGKVDRVFFLVNREEGEGRLGIYFRTGLKTREWMIFLFLSSDFRDFFDIRRICSALTCCSESIYDFNSFPWTKSLPSHLSPSKSISKPLIPFPSTKISNLSFLSRWDGSFVTSAIIRCVKEWCMRWERFFFERRRKRKRKKTEGGCELILISIYFDE